MLAHNALRRVQAKPGALAHSFGGKERLKDMRQDFLWNSRPVIGYLHYHAGVIAIRADTKLSLAAHGVNGIVNNVGPDLVELAAKGIHQKRNSLIVALHRNSA